MLSFGWSEIALVVVVVVIVVGPKELPNLLRQLGAFSKSLKKLIILTRGDKGAIAIYGDEVV